MTVDSTLSDQRKYDARSRRDRDRLILHVTCRIHEGAQGFTNLVVTMNNDTIVLNPHVDNSCVLTLDEITARVFHDALGEWLDRKSSALLRS